MLDVDFAGLIHDFVRDVIWLWQAGDAKWRAALLIFAGSFIYSSVKAGMK